MIKSIIPPQISKWIISRFTIDYNHFPALGDLDEEFYYLCENANIIKARGWYRFQVIKSIPYLINHIIYWSITMFGNYVKIAMRNLYKNKLYSVINIFGLGVAVAVCLVGYVNYQLSQSYDAFHKNKDDLYLINTYRIVNENRINMANSPTMLSPSITEQLSGIDNYTRIARDGAIIRYKDKVFNETVYYLDDSFFDLFTFPVISGEKDALKDMNSIIINDEIAVKYFGAENPIGEQIILSPNGEKEYGYFVRGVIEKASTVSSLRPTICVPYKRQEDMLGYDLEDWKDWTSAAFIQANDQADPAQIENLMQKYLPQVKEANVNFPVEGFYLTPLLELAFSTRDIGGPFFSGFHPAAVIAPSVIALLILLLACFNFVNTSMAFASRRLKEIGIRKVIGGIRRQLISQFLGENLILCFFALILGVLLAKPFMNFYDSLWPEMDFYIDYLKNPELLGFIIVLLIFTAVASGAYPALYVSRFNPVTIFRGKQKLGGTNPLIRILITLQFSISILAILSGIILYNNGEFIENFDLGFNKEQVLIVPVRNNKNFELLKSVIEKHPGIESIGASNHLVGRSWSRRDIEIDQTQSRVPVLDIGENYFETNGFQIAAGNKFDASIKAEAEETIMINETLAQTYGLTTPIDKFIKLQSPAPGKEYRIIGVVKDFHLNGLWRKVEPMIIRYLPAENNRWLSLKFNLVEHREISEYIQETWRRLFPNLPYDGFFQTEMLAEASQITRSIKLIFIYIALIAVITSGLGLFALVSLNIVRRTKELGIRRVLGASSMNIGYLISKEFLILLIFVSIAGAVLGYFSMTALLSSIWAYYVDFGILPFIYSGLLMLFIALMTVGLRIFSVATKNPVDSIRYE